MRCSCGCVQLDASWAVPSPNDHEQLYGACAAADDCDECCASTMVSVGRSLLSERLVDGYILCAGGSGLSR